MAKRIFWFAAAFTVAMGTLVLFPGIDLWASGLFYRPGAGFFPTHWPIFTWPRLAVPYVTALLAAVYAALIFVPGRRRAGIYLLLALALGPGLAVNTVLKDHWGRARPDQVIQFGGDKFFVSAWRPSDQCTGHCSFPAGDPSVGFSLAAAAFLVRGRKARRWAIAGALGLGAFLGLMRIAQGGHFLSDVVASGFIVFGIDWALYRLLIAWDGFGALWASLKKPPPGLKHFMVVSAGAALAFAYALAFLDRPLADFAHGAGPFWQGVFRFITGFGIATPYLVVAAVAAGLHFVVAGVVKKRHRKAQILSAWRAGFVFLAVAVSGLIADLIKPVAGRARPGLFFTEHVSGFTWFGPRAGYWSFPSGHSVTAAALAFALCVIYPRWRWAWIAAALLIGVSRIGLDQHHLSDVIGGFYIGLATAWALYAVFRYQGIALSDSPGSPAKTARYKSAPRRRPRAR
jgi:lipid A 4'-phosphatase